MCLGYQSLAPVLPLFVAILYLPLTAFHPLSLVNPSTVHTTAMAVALQHQLTAAGIGGLLKPATGVGATMAGLPTNQASASALQLSGDGEAAASALTLLEPPGAALLHPALRNVKTINIGEWSGGKG